MRPQLVLLLFLAGLLAACGQAAATATPPAATASPLAATAVSPTRTRPPETAVPAPTAAPETAAATPTPAPTARAYAGSVPAPEFPAGLDWLNTPQPLTLADLRGKVVLLDFWTYGCINCLHVIPDLKRLEEKYAAELIVIGVHSAKFTTEGETANIRQIVQRYELAHPVVNDRDFAIWNSYGARAWPTFALIDPDGNVLGFHSGEGIYALFDEVIGGMVAEFDALGKIDRTPLPLRLETAALANSPLLFPAKVLADAENGRLFIADTNHDRLVITDLDGVVLDVVGSGVAGLGDGAFADAQFFRPHGLALADANTLYVADTENHAIRRVRLATGTVETVAGTGQQSAYQFSEGRGTDTGLNSPWDLLWLDGELLIAMAGQHQLWAYDPAADLIRVYAGTGREALLDGPLTEAAFNQPSGLAADGGRLYVADSEASAIRLVSDGGVQTLVGVGLFEFGDVDGTGAAVRLQHPLGVAAAGGRVYVADTYNHKIKLLDPASGAVRTLFGSGKDGWRDGADPLFDEPGGLSLAGERLYVADTNNHAVRVADLRNGRVATLVLVDPQGLLTRTPAGAPYRGAVVTLAPQTVAAGAGSLRLDVTLPPGYKLNDLAPFSATLAPAGGVRLAETQIQVVSPAFPLELPANFEPGEATLQADLVIYYCEAAAESLCLLEQVRLIAPVTVAAGGSAVLALPYAVPEPAE